MHHDKAYIIHSMKVNNLDGIFGCLGIPWGLLAQCEFIGNKDIFFSTLHREILHRTSPVCNMG